MSATPARRRRDARARRREVKAWEARSGPVIERAAESEDDGSLVWTMFGISREDLRNPTVSHPEKLHDLGNSGGDAA